MVWGEKGVRCNEEFLRESPGVVFVCEIGNGIWESMSGL